MLRAKSNYFFTKIVWAICLFGYKKKPYPKKYCNPSQTCVCDEKRLPEKLLDSVICFFFM